MITGTFNGWNIVSTPLAPTYASVELTMNDSISANTSPYTHQAQTIDWQTDWWAGLVSLPNMPRHYAQTWIAFLAELRGSGAAFYLGDAVGAIPSGWAHGICVTAGTNASRSSTLAVTGFKPSMARQLLPGDYFQIGARLHQNLEVVNSDSTGSATLNIWPRIRESPAPGTPVIFHNAVGLFRLSTSERSFNISVDHIYNINFKVEEAL